MSPGPDTDSKWIRAPIALYRASSDGLLEDGNSALARLLGFGSEVELLDRPDCLLLSFADDSEQSKWLRAISESVSPAEFDTQLIQSDGTSVHVRHCVKTVQAGGAQWAEGAIIDMTDTVAAKKARDLFIATVSHELRNPIAVVLGMSQLMAKEPDRLSDEEITEMIRVVASQAEDAAWIIEDLLVSHRSGAHTVSLTPESFEVEPEVRRVLEGEARQIATEFTEGVVARADPRRTRQIVRNLLSNAIRYGGTSVKVVTSMRGPSVAISVCDDGEPLSEDDRTKIFQPFQTGPGPANPRSVGLGLSVAHDLALAMGGTLQYDHDGDYSCFTLTLPKGEQQ